MSMLWINRSCMSLRRSLCCCGATWPPRDSMCFSKSRSISSGLSRSRAAACVKVHRAAATGAALAHAVSAAEGPGPSQQQRRAIQIYFSAEEVHTTAEPGENLWGVASKAGVVIPTSCGTGSCGTCEMEVRKWDEQGVEGGRIIARTCIAAVPPGFSRLQIDTLDDAIWGMDGFDTNTAAANLQDTYCMQTKKHGCRKTGYYKHAGVENAAVHAHGRFAVLQIRSRRCSNCSALVMKLVKNHSMLPSVVPHD